MIKISKKQIGYSFLTILGVLCFVYICSISRSQLSQQGAERFSGDGQHYAQISSFFTEDSTINESNINNYRSSVQKSLEEASLKSKYANARLWVDCYSGKAKVKAIKGKTTEDVTMIGVGGDFFLFHPITMLEGYYFSTSDVMKDRILIDKEVAWQLFGSTDVVGMNVQVGNTTCVVAGVFELSDDKATKKAVGKTPMIFAPFEMLSQVTGAGTTGSGATSAGNASGGTSNGGSSNSATIRCYEILLPNPVSGFAKQIMLKIVAGVDLTSTTSSEIDLDALKVEILENTNRFSFVRLLETMKSVGTRSMHTKPMEYPFWENVARAKEDLAIIFLRLMILIFLFPAIAIVRWGWKRFKQRKWTLKRLKRVIEEKAEAKKKKKWEELKYEKEKSIN